jgi:lipopolysaccharide biosynthesis glycosyltransferase
MDCDMILLTDIQELFDQADEKYAVMCVHHDYTPREGFKMDGQKQSIYPRKNWSSVMLFNCGHPSNKQINSSVVNNTEITGKYLHRFSWLQDSEIGQLSHEWNWLTDWYKEPEDGKPKLLHYTEGGPWFENYRDCDYHKEWKIELADMMNVSD